MMGFADGAKVLFEEARAQGKSLSHLLGPCLRELLWHTPKAYSDWADQWKGEPAWFMDPERIFTANFFNEEHRKSSKHPDVVNLLFELGGVVTYKDHLAHLEARLSAMTRRFEGSFMEAEAVVDPVPARKSEEELIRAIKHLVGQVSWKRTPADAGSFMECQLEGSSIGIFEQNLFDGLNGKDRTGMLLFDYIGSLCAQAALQWAKPESAPKVFATLLSNELRFLQAKRASPGFSLGEYARQTSEQREKLDTFPDIVRRISCEIYLPAMTKSPCSHEIALNLKPEATGELIHHAYNETLLRIIGKRPLRELMKLNKFMHQPITALPIETRPFLATLAWQPLLEKHVYLPDGYVIRSLASAVELRDEGVALSHCVGNGTYSFFCSQGSHQILSLSRHDRARATILLEKTSAAGLFTTGKNEWWRVKSFLGEKNAIPSEDDKRALQNFGAYCGVGEVSFHGAWDLWRLQVQAGFNKMLPAFELYTGMPLDEPDLVGAIEAHYERINDAWKRDTGEALIDLSEAPSKSLKEFI
jgi:hypothetical protein